MTLNTYSFAVATMERFDKHSRAELNLRANGDPAIYTGIGSLDPTTYSHSELRGGKMKFTTNWWAKRYRF